MENVVFTQLSITEVRQLFRQELENYFTTNPPKAPHQTPADDLIKIDQAAELLNLSKDTIYRLVGKKEIPSCKRASRLYFSKAQLVEWVKAGQRKTTSEIEAEAKQYLQQKRKGGRRG